MELPASIFEAKVNRDLMHQALVRQMANARVGTHDTKDRREIARTTAKWFRQKGTGRARHGSRKAPIFVGGGIAHGPHPREYSKQMPRKMRHAALRSALTAKANSGDVVLLDSLTMERPKTKEMVALVRRLVGEDTALVLLPTRDEIVEKSARNLQEVKALNAVYLNIRDLLGHRKLVLTVGSLDVLEGLLGNGSGVAGVASTSMEEEE